MARGKVPDPGRERRKTGNRPAAGKRKPAPPATIPGAGAVVSADPPADLPPVAAEAWRLAVDEMSGNRQLRPPDLVLLKTYCEAVYVHEEASAAIHKYGILVTGTQGQPMANPMIRVQKDAAGTIRQLSDVLGLNPLARIRAGIMEIAGQTMVHELRERLAGKIANG